MAETNQNDIIQSQMDNVLKRDIVFTQFLEDFSRYQEKKNSQQNKHKNRFFWVVCISFLTVVVGSMAAIILIAQKSEISITDLGVVLGSVTSLVSVIIVLPSKIADNLFPADGEKDFTKFFIAAHREDIAVGRASDDVSSDEEIYDELKQHIPDDSE